jgi:glycosyltransferase involved in cell wall biosynthesis
MPTVSVIIPTRNRHALLARALQSVAAQTVAPVQLIVVDDASGDQTALVAGASPGLPLQYVKLDRPGGGAVARNRGISAATGDFVAFLDDDDCWAPTKLREQVDAMSGSSSILCYTGKRAMVSGGGRSYYSFKRPRYSDQSTSIMADNYIGITSSVLVRRDALQRIGGFDESLPAFQDWDVYIRLLSNGAAVGIDRPLVDYDMSDRPGQVSFDWDRISRAASMLRTKYARDPHYRLLRRGLLVICVKKALKSRRFALGALKALLEFPGHRGGKA